MNPTPQTDQYKDLDSVLGIFRIVDSEKVSPAAPPVLTKEEYIDLIQALILYIEKRKVNARIDEVKYALEVVNNYGMDTNMAGIINTLATRRDGLIERIDMLTNLKERNHD